MFPIKTPILNSTSPCHRRHLLAARLPRPPPVITCQAMNPRVSFAVFKRTEWMRPALPKCWQRFVCEIYFLGGVVWGKLKEHSRPLCRKARRTYIGVVPGECRSCRRCCVLGWNSWVSSGPDIQHEGVRFLSFLSTSDMHTVTSLRPSSKPFQGGVGITAHSGQSDG